VVGNVSPDGMDVYVSATFKGRVTPADRGGFAHESGATRWIAYLVARDATGAELRAVSAQREYYAGEVDPRHLSFEVKASRPRSLFGRRRRNKQLPTV
jgi:hypothetical protein